VGVYAERAIGISVHTGWGACVVVSGSLAKPEIVANELIELLPGPERFCFHAAVGMERAAAESLIAAARDKALTRAREAMARLVTHETTACAIVAKQAQIGDLDEVLASHPRIHTAEGCFYRDVWREACSIPTCVIPPSALDPSRVGKVGVRPWGRDQKLAALAAFSVRSSTPG
jgi:hypothetical protein